MLPLWILLESKGDGGGGSDWSYKMCKAPVKSSPPPNQHPAFLQARSHSCCPTNSVRALKENCAFKVKEKKEIQRSENGCDWETVSLIIKKGRLRCLGHVEHTYDVNMVKCSYDNRMLKGCLSKNRWDCTRKNMEFWTVLRGCAIQE